MEIKRKQNEDLESDETVWGKGGRKGVDTREGGMKRNKGDTEAKKKGGRLGKEIKEKRDGKDRRKRRNLNWKLFSISYGDSEDETRP